MQQLSISRIVKKVKQYLPAYLATILLGYLAAFVFFASEWAEENFLLHTINEVICISLLLFSFMHIWNTYKETDCFVQWVGIAALAMVLLNLPHVVNLTNFIGIPHSVANLLMDISLKYGVLIAYTEIIIWVLLLFYHKSFSLNKWIGLMLSIAAAVLMLTILVNIINYIPDFYSEPSATMIKHYADFMLSLTAFAVICLYVRKHIYAADDREKTMQGYIIIALCFFMPARICFALSWEVTEPIYFLGHIFKVAYYYSIYYGVYKTTIEYPYRQVRKVKDFYENLLDASPIGIIAFDAKGEISYANRQCDTLFRYEMRKLYGTTMEQLLDSILLYDSSKSELLEKLKNLEKGSCTFYGLPHFAGEGACKLIITVMSLEVGIVFAVRDAKKAQALENMKLQAQTLLDSTDNLIFLLDINSKVVMCNRKFLDLTSTTKNDIIGLNLMELSELLKSNLKDCMNISNDGEEIMQDATWCINTLKGELKKVNLNSSPIYDVDNEKIGWIVIGRDVSEYDKKQEKLIHSEKMAVIGQMAAGLVHEIKNPLASIKGLCQLLISRAKPEKVSEYAAVMEQAVDDIGDIVTSFLQFSRPISGNFEETQINKLVNSLEMMISSNAYKRGIRTWFYYSDTEEPVIIKSQQIKNVILGMIDNALDALSGAIDPKLVITTEHDRSGNMMKISIKDNGIGMTEEQLACIGTPFYTTKPRGTGLGVSVIEYIINEHKGTLKIESKFGEGAVFTVGIPCKTAD